jgi:hypothetical protein
MQEGSPGVYSKLQRTASPVIKASKPVSLLENIKNKFSIGKEQPLASAVRKAYTNPVSTPERGIDKKAPKPLEQMKITKIPRVLKTALYARNTGIQDENNNDYINIDDAELLNKLGFEVNPNDYLFLAVGDQREDVYSYVEKVAGVSKEVSKAIDKGESFSAEYLKELDYDVPKGYELKGDLCCPVEKKASVNLDKDQNIKNYDFSGKVQGVGLRKAVHHILDKYKDPGLMYNDARTGKTHLSLYSPQEKQKKILKALEKYLANRTDDNPNLKRNVDYWVNELPASNSDKKHNVKFTLKDLNKFIKTQALYKFLEVPEEKRIKYFIDRYRLNPDGKGNLIGSLPDLAYKQLYGKEPVYDYQLKPDWPTYKQLSKKAAADHPLKSTNIKAVGYDKENKTLEVEFHSGGTYKYNDVPKSLFDRIKKVKSPGKFFHKHIRKDDKYEYNKLDEKAVG